MTKKRIKRHKIQASIFLTIKFNRYDIILSNCYESLMLTLNSLTYHVMGSLKTSLQTNARKWAIL